MGGFQERFGGFMNNRWLVFVAAMWIQSCAGVGYLFGSISPVVKSSLDYNQRQLARLGVAKDLGNNVGFLAGSLSEILPFWGSLLVGCLQNFVGFGWLWLVVTGRAPVLPLWAMCILIFVASNGDTYFNTTSLVSCVQNFPDNRGPVVGILKGFAGLSGAILTQAYAMIHSPNQASLIFMVAVGPPLLVIAVMFIIKPVESHRQVRPSDAMSFMFVYGVCLILAVYLMGVMLFQDLVVHLSNSVITIFSAVMFVLLLTPIAIPMSLSFCFDPRNPKGEPLLPEPQKLEPEILEHEVAFSEVEDDEKPKADDLLPALEKQKRIAQLQADICLAATEGAVKIKRRRGPHRGEDFTLMQALIKADFWLIFFSFLMGSGSGLTVIDNLGQMSQSLGYDNTHIFVSMISIWNFLGRVGGGYFSEVIVRDYVYPRPVALAVAQFVMAVGHVFFAFGWPGAMYIGTLLIGLGYGAHWAIVPAAVSELFGLKKFGALYNFLILATPGGSLVFSGLIASTIYDREAEKQAREHPYLPGSLFSRFLGEDKVLKCEGSVCFFLTSMIMSGFCIVGLGLSMILVHRTKIVYANMYAKPRT